MEQQIFTSRQAQAIIAYVRKRYGDELEFLWQKFPQNAVWRNQVNRKWYALLLTVSRSRLSGHTTGEKIPSKNTSSKIPDDRVEVIDLRFPQNEALDFAESNTNVYPGYHMNKNNWITIILDNSMPTEQILSLLDHSYDISLQK